MKHDDLGDGDEMDSSVEPSGSGVVLDTSSANSYHNHHSASHQSSTGTQPQQAGTSASGQQQWVLDDRMKRMLMDLQRHWLNDYQQSREKMLVEMTEKLHQEFLSDQQKIRTDLLTQFKEELDTTRNDLEQKYRESVRQETAKLAERFRREMSANKKKQWCWQCEAEAIYHCCWNTAYCSVECQQQHWPQHRRNCRRKRNPAMGGANNNGLQQIGAANGGSGGGNT